MTQELQTITIGESTFLINELPSDVKELIRIHQKWTADVTESKLRLAKDEAAVRQAANEIMGAIRAAEERGVLKPYSDDPVVEAPAVKEEPSA